MISFPKLLSLRNGLRLSGLIALAVGTPMTICPAIGVFVFLGKRETPDTDKRALNLTMRSNGIAVFSAGLSAMLAKPSPGPLVATTVMEIMYSIYHLGYRFSGEWERAKGRKSANVAFGPMACLAVLAQGYALGWGEREDDE